MLNRSKKKVQLIVIQLRLTLIDTLRDLLCNRSIVISCVYALKTIVSSYQFIQYIIVWNHHQQVSACTILYMTAISQNKLPSTGTATQHNVNVIQAISKLTQKITFILRLTNIIFSRNWLSSLNYVYLVKSLKITYDEIENLFYHYVCEMRECIGER